jgi:hypothetical protein
MKATRKHTILNQKPAAYGYEAAKAVINGINKVCKMTAPLFVMR